jgi:hypothetical protein
MLSLPSACRNSLDCQCRTCPVFVFLLRPGRPPGGSDARKLRPLGLHRPAPSNSILHDYKVYRIAMADFEAAGLRSHYRLRWGGQAHRTGVRYAVRSHIRSEDANESTTCGDRPWRACPGCTGH